MKPVKKKRLDSPAAKRARKRYRIRGLLCQTCNRGIGLLGDTIKSIEKTLAYLKGTL